MDVITTHTNSDFDTLASLVGAGKLYPEAKLVFPGSLEKGVRRGLKEGAFPVEFTHPRDINLDDITRLILVDTRSRTRIGHFSEVLEREGVEVHIYDHHPVNEGDLRGDVEVVEDYGATSTIITLILKERNIFVTPEEATLLMAGIYEDTGNLTFPSTAGEDFEAARYLLSKGGDLTEVSRLLRDEITSDEIRALNELLSSSSAYTVGSLSVTIAEGHISTYKGDVATLAHRLQYMEGVEGAGSGVSDGIFILADMGNRIHVVGRSSSGAMDVGAVARILGGGGHRRAASATLKGLSTIQCREKVLEALRSTVTPVKVAADIMSHPPITIKSTTTIDEAAGRLERYNINAIPVLDEKGEAVEGIITRQVAGKAIRHGLGAEAVKDYVNPDFHEVRPETTLDEIRYEVIGYSQRLLPVVDKGTLRGVITRTDLIRLLQEDLAVEAEGLEGGPGRKRKNRHVKNLLREAMPGWALQDMEEIGREAERSGCKAYLVGGIVRDLLLRHKNLDIDIVIEGDGIGFAKTFAEKRGLKVRCHERFKTAVLIYPSIEAEPKPETKPETEPAKEGSSGTATEGTVGAEKGSIAVKNGPPPKEHKVDIATARLEFYDHPGALPTVEGSSLKLDLYRRDFTINTLSIDLTPGRFGLLLDFFGGQRDLKEGKLRVLHNLSFVEDPTRILRGLRFSEKLSFSLGKHTEVLMKNGVRSGLLKKVSGGRILTELRYILEEEKAAPILKRLEGMNILEVLGDMALAPGGPSREKGGEAAEPPASPVPPPIRWDEETEEIFKRGEETLAWYKLLYKDEEAEGWLVLLLLLSWRLTEKELRSLGEELGISGKRRKCIINSRKRGLESLELIGDPDLRTSTLYTLLKDLPIEVTLYIMALTTSKEAKVAISRYITDLTDTRTILTGKELMALGIPEGEKVGERLSALLLERLDGKVVTKEDEIESVKRSLTRQG